MEKLSKNFTFEELIYSATASRYGIDNTPTQQGKQKLKRLAQEILQPIRNAWGKPIIITSGYRCDKVNSLVNGSKNSQHRLCEAADIKVGGIQENKKLFELIAKMVRDGKIKVGQLINEYNYSWVHVSLPRSGKPNNQIFAIK